MKIDIDLKNRRIVDFFVSSLENVLAGMYDQNDKRYMKSVIAEAQQKRPDDWSEDTRKEFADFLLTVVDMFGYSSQYKF